MMLFTLIEISFLKNESINYEIFINVNEKLIFSFKKRELSTQIFNPDFYFFI
jgi:hypothetical protein